mmetsp:Transcript_11677/g.26708  ORF Transcript_11677/g.26708 Transcript_11677/m.26708 type:complete len:111 (+) Transcript_11677:2269-2601(+)
MHCFRGWRTRLGGSGGVVVWCGLVCGLVWCGGGLAAAGAACGWWAMWVVVVGDQSVHGRPPSPSLLVVGWCFEDRGDTDQSVSKTALPPSLPASSLAESREPCLRREPVI